jgi:hypothetical protein
MKKTTKKIEVPMVTLEIEVTEEFFNTMETAKADVEKKLQRDMEYGEYIETCLNDLVYLTAVLERQLNIMKNQGFHSTETDNDGIYG